MRYPKFSEFQEARAKGLADSDPAAPKSPYPAGEKSPVVGRGLGDEEGGKPNPEGRGIVRNLMQKGLGDEAAKLTSDQAVPKEGKISSLYDADDGVAGDGSYDGMLNTVPVNNRDPQPYKYAPDTTGVIVAGNEDPTTGLGFKGSPGLPKSTSIVFSRPSMRVRTGPDRKLTSEEFINTTKSMSASEFINFYKEDIEESDDESLPTITDLNGNQFTPDPNQTVEYLAHLASKNPRLMARFVREVKRHEGGFNKLYSESQEHPEFITEVIGSMAAEDGAGKKFCQKLSRGMNDKYMTALDNYVVESRVAEEVSAKNSLSVEDGGPVGSPPSNPSGMAPPKPSSNLPGGAFGGGGPGGPTPPAPGGAFGGGGPGGPTPPAPGGAFGGGGPSGPPGFDGGGMTPPQPTPRLKGETAHGNLIESMGGYPHMFTHMSEYCVNCKK